MQLKESSVGAKMQSHYVIPNESSVGPGIIQMARHGESVQIMNSLGSFETVQNRIIVMLTGNSGRYVEGVRTHANPLWLSDYQLRLLGVALTEICFAIERAEGLPRNQCLSSHGPNSLIFRKHSQGFYRWGDIPDFDDSIVFQYLGSSDGVGTSVNLEKIGGSTMIEAGQPFVLSVKFPPSSRRLVIERLVRLPGADSRVIWEIVHQVQVRNASTIQIDDMTWHDAGPNLNGDQFFRVKVYGEGGKFLGWSTRLVQLKGYEPAGS
jgi:hypothetical protein